MSDPIKHPVAINPTPSPEPKLKQYARATVQWYEGHFAEKSRVEPAPDPDAPIGDPGPLGQWGSRHPHKQEGS